MNINNKGFTPIVKFGTARLGRAHIRAVPNSTTGFTPSVENGLVQKHVRQRRTRPFFTAGFTLIEVLMIIVIMGILSSVVMSAMRIARNNGADTGIRANLGNVRIQAQIYFDGNGGYGTAGTSCTNPSSIFSDITIIRQLSSASSTAGVSPVCANTNTKWVVSIPLFGDGSWCVDTTNIAKSGVADTINVRCP